MKKKKIIITIISIIVIILLLIILFNYNTLPGYFNPGFSSSNKTMVVFQGKNDENDMVMNFYCIFDSNKKCIASFAEIENPSQSMLKTVDTDFDFGYVKPILKDNVIYAEYTGLRGMSYDEIKQEFSKESDKIIKEWSF